MSLYPKSIPLKYPLLLVHGVGARDDNFFGKRYWGRIAAHLRENGLKVYTGGTEAWATIETNAEILEQTIQKICRENQVNKINIIAHSKGGLDSRYLISTLKCGAVASLTTIATPHHGLKTMNLVYHIPKFLYHFAAVFVNGYFRLFGDEKPDFFKTSRQLSQRFFQKFNPDNPDNPDIYYQSYAVKLKHFYSSPLFLITFPIIRWIDGENDGLCPINSAEWTNFKGVLTSTGHFGISHTGITDSFHLSYKNFNLLEFYRNLAKELADKGL
jgi:triacylglycerol lipase